MTNAQISEELEKVYDQVFELMGQLSEANFNFSPEANRWTVAQHLEHLVLSTRPLNQALQMPRLALKSMFGKNNRMEKSYEEVVKKYKGKLAEGGQAPSRYLHVESEHHKEQIRQDLKQELEKLHSALSKWKEEKMSQYVLPHPLLGKLTIREMFYFTIYHTMHHTNILKTEYKVSNL